MHLFMVVTLLDTSQERVVLALMVSDNSIRTFESNLIIEPQRLNVCHLFEFGYAGYDVVALTSSGQFSHGCVFMSCSSNSCTYEMVGLRIGGGDRMVEVSRMPLSDIWRVRGIGVADSVKTSTQMHINFNLSF